MWHTMASACQKTEVLAEPQVLAHPRVYCAVEATSSSFVIDFSVGIVFSVHRTPPFSSAFSLSCASLAHWDTNGCGSARCISRQQI